jgi:hypothetical protein
LKLPLAFGSECNMNVENNGTIHCGVIRWGKRGVGENSPRHQGLDSQK